MKLEDYGISVRRHRAIWFISNVKDFPMNKDTVYSIYVKGKPYIKYYLNDTSYIFSDFYGNLLDGYDINLPFIDLLTECFPLEDLKRLGR